MVHYVQTTRIDIVVYVTVTIVTVTVVADRVFLYCTQGPY